MHHESPEFPHDFDPDPAIDDALDIGPAFDDDEAWDDVYVLGEEEEVPQAGFGSWHDTFDPYFETQPSVN